MEKDVDVIETTSTCCSDEMDIHHMDDVYGNNSEDGQENYLSVDGSDIKSHSGKFCRFLDFILIKYILIFIFS